MRTYGQYCPVARGAEILAEPWMPVIIRNLALGCATPGEIREGAPGLSPTLLSDRLEQLEGVGLVSSEPEPKGRGRYYQLTEPGRDLMKVCLSLGEWGATWLDLGPQHLDPYIALWVMTRTFDWGRLPARRVVVRFDFTGREQPERFWMLIELGDSRISRSDPGLDVDLHVTADTEVFVRWRAGHLTWSEAAADGRIDPDGSSELVGSFPDWAPIAFAKLARF